MTTTHPLDTIQILNFLFMKKTTAFSIRGLLSKAQSRIRETTHSRMVRETLT